MCNRLPGARRCRYPGFLPAYWDRCSARKRTDHSSFCTHAALHLTGSECGRHLPFSQHSVVYEVEGGRVWYPKGHGRDVKEVISHNAVSS